MTNLDKQLEELISERNAFEAENIVLKAQVNALRDGVTWFNRSGGDLTKLLTAYIDAPEQCVNSIKADSIESAATACFDAGYRRPVSFLRVMASEIRGGDELSYKA